MMADSDNEQKEIPMGWEWIIAFEVLLLGVLCNEKARFSEIAFVSTWICLALRPLLMFCLTLTC